MNGITSPLNGQIKNDDKILKKVKDMVLSFKETDKYYLK